MNNIKKSFKNELYIGLNDKNDYIEKFSLKEIVDMIGDYCEKKKISFSVSQMKGGYAHNQGYIIENSLKITVISENDEAIHEIGTILKKIVNTDTIMYTKEECEILYV